jgi:hypothetical protein
LVALAITQESLNIFSMIGIIMLLGVATKNSILLVDYTNHLIREEHMDPLKALIRAGRVQDAYELTRALPVDLRVAVKPFFTNFTSGRTTEAVTAHAVADIVSAIVECRWQVVPAQVVDPDRWGGLTEPLAVPVVLGPNGWLATVGIDLADDEREALQVANAAVTASIAGVLGAR